MAGGAFQIRSKKWDVGVLIGSLAVLLVGFGGLFLLQRTDSAGNPTLLFVVFLGMVTFAFFAGPGIVYVLRKRNAWVKSKLPGGTMAWIRSHLYLPILALVAGYVHATVVPFRAHLSSGKVLLALGILVSIAGVCRHHLIGVQKAALNVNVAISKISTGQPRAFRRLVADFTDTARPVGEIDAEMAQFPPDLQERWAKIKQLRAEVDKHFPRTGGQTTPIRSYKLWRALHPPLTILLFVVLGYHMWDVLGGVNPLNNDEKLQFVSAQSCAGCHSKTYAEWGASVMSHAQTSTITEAQLPVTLAHNRLLADQGQVAANNQNPDKSVNQDDIFKATAKVCITCHSPVGARFAANPDALYPFDNADTAGVKAKGTAVDGGGPASQSDGVSCQVCHGTSKPPAELQAAFGPLNNEKSSLGGFGSVFAPLFENPNPLPQRIHDIGNGDNSFWNDSVAASQICGACHNVKADLQGDGLANDPNAPDGGKGDPTVAQTNLDNLDTNGAPITDLSTAQSHDRNDNLELDENEVDATKDVVLQTTYDEWQDYVAFFDADKGFKNRYSSDNLSNFANPLSSPLGCSDCHMPLESKDKPTSGVVDHAPGILSIPNREYHTHTFVGVDYDLDLSKYNEPGLGNNALDKALAEREALVRSAVTLQVTPADGSTGQTGLVDVGASPLATQNGEHGKLVTFDVLVRNNLLAHTFPTGFAFARQFWLEVSATTKDGQPVCLSVPFVDAQGTFPVSTPCASGVLGVDSNTDPGAVIKKANDGPSSDDTEQDLKQCDTTAVAKSLGLDVDTLKANKGKDAATGITIPNIDVQFSKPFGVDDCDPWLSNFQKILTDGDPDQTGTKKEAAFQSFVANLVQIRGRVANGQPMKDLQPVRLDDDKNEQQTATLPYTFFVPDSLGLTSTDDIVVTAKMRVRHLPPYFVSGLAQEQQDILTKGFNVPEGARIFSDNDHPNRLEDLLSSMTVTEVGSATSSDGNETLGCDKGAQNVEGGSIFDCIKDGRPQFTVKGPAFAKAGSALPAGHPVLSSPEKAADAGPMALASAMAFSMVTPVGWWRVRRRRRRSAHS